MSSLTTAHSSMYVESLAQNVVDLYVYPKWTFVSTTAYYTAVSA